MPSGNLPSLEPDHASIPVETGSTSIVLSVLRLVPRGWRWLRGRVRRATAQQRVALFPESINVEVRSAFWGQLYVRARVMNAWRKRLTAERVELDQWVIDGRVMPRQAVMLGRERGPYTRNRSAHLSFEMPLNVAEVRAMVESGRQPSDPRSTPDYQVQVNGTVWFNDGRRAHPVEFQWEVRNAVVRFTPGVG